MVSLLCNFKERSKATEDGHIKWHLGIENVHDLEGTVRDKESRKEPAETKSHVKNLYRQRVT